MKDFRPIACCSTLYKIIAKVITTRIKGVIQGIVGHSQSAFIEGRSIVDNILFSHELFKGYTRKGMSAKKFVNWVMECVQTVSYSLVINGGLVPPFKGQRGIRADFQSIKLLNKTFKLFSDASGLQANVEKSSLYVTGVTQRLKTVILQTLGYIEGTFPFRYLGVPLSTKKLTIS
ncbi:uncharacterized protein LOC132611885 [Lycium barbarum]|uniref:uncharacterized protein LOC132611885 n=1 Tax=Lycium barbarum TaxID=112863 RepID=UPI00293EBE08|nr:uncharacterized protein LOC132611885 [Lycium barbarum]